MSDNWKKELLNSKNVKDAADKILKKSHENGDRISQNGCINLSIDERKIILLNNSIEAIDSAILGDKKSALDLVFNLCKNCFNDFDYLIGLTPGIVYIGKPHASTTRMLRCEDPLEDLKERAIEASKRNKFLCLYYFTSFGQAVNTFCENIPVIRYCIVDFNYKPYLVGKRFNQNDQERKLIL